MRKKQSVYRLRIGRSRFRLSTPFQDPTREESVVELESAEVDVTTDNKFDSGKWLAVVISVVALLVSGYSIWNQYLFEKWKDERATPVLAADYELRGPDTGKRVEDWRCPVLPCLLFNIGVERFSRNLTPSALVVRNRSATTIAGNVRVVIEVSCPFVVYAVSCPECATDEYAHSKRDRRDFTTPEDYHRMTVTIPALELGGSREFLLGLAWRAGDACPRSKEQATIQITMTGDHNGHFTSGALNVLTGAK